MGEEKFDKEYMLNGRRIRVRYANEKSFEDFLYESINTSFVPRILEELESMKKL
jgi:hypothetical protein